LLFKCLGLFSCRAEFPYPCDLLNFSLVFALFLTPLTYASNPVAKNSFAPELAEAVVLGIVATFKDKNTA
jgi:hypothetical protein